MRERCNVIRGVRRRDAKSCEIEDGYMLAPSGRGRSRSIPYLSVGILLSVDVALRRFRWKICKEDGRWVGLLGDVRL
jgi:hypothetical protein